MDQAENSFIRQLEKKKKELTDSISDPADPCRDHIQYRERLARIDELNEMIKLARKAFSGDESDEEPGDKK